MTATDTHAAILDKHAQITARINSRNNVTLVTWLRALSCRTELTRGERIVQNIIIETLTSRHPTLALAFDRWLQREDDRQTATEAILEAATAARLTSDPALRQLTGKA